MLFEAPLNLPHGAVLTSLTCYYQQHGLHGSTPTVVSISGDIYRASMTSAGAPTSLVGFVNSSNTPTRQGSTRSRRPSRALRQSI